MENIDLCNCPIFKGIPKVDLQLLSQLKFKQKKFKKGEIIFHTGSKTEALGIIRDGRIQIESTDFWGNKSILDNIGQNKVFAETYALTETPFMVDVTAIEDSEIMFISPKYLFDIKEENAVQSDTMKLISSIILRNILEISMKKNLHLSQRIFHTSSKTIRGKILSYLSSFSIKNNTEFDIPFNRQQLADYLQADRSALSAELSKMKKEGLIDYWKNHFKLLKKN